MKNKSTEAAEIVRLAGGEENIVSASNCMTRLRLTVLSEDKVDENALKALNSVQGLVHDRKNKYEIVVGPGKSRKLADELREMGVGHSAGGEEASGGGKGNKLRGFVKVIGDIFVPLIPGVMTAGLCAGFAMLIIQICPDYESSRTLTVIYNILTLISTSFMTYITAWAGYRAAERFGATPIIGGMLGMLTSLDGINKIAATLGLYNAENPLNSILCAGKGGVLAVIFGVFLLSIVEKWIRKVIPESMDIILTPLLSLVICVIPYVAIVMPAFGYLSAGIASLFGFFCNSGNIIVRIIVGYISAAAFIPLVTTGMHHGLVALYTVQLQELGYITLYPSLAMAGAGQVGAAIAILIMAKRAKNERFRKAAATGLPAGILGIGEPLIYGVTLPLGKPFITAGLGAGFGGAFVMAMQVASTTWGPSGVPGVFVMTAGPNGALINAVVYISGLLISCIGGFIITRLCVKEKDLRPKDADLSHEKEPKETNQDLDRRSFDIGMNISYPADGIPVAMGDIPDPVFSSGTLGKCIGIIPENGMIYAPCSGTVAAVAETGHAVSIESADGGNILVHVGIDTVSLGGKGFDVKVSTGQEISSGQLIMEADLGIIKAAGLSDMVIVVNCS